MSAVGVGPVPVRSVAMPYGEWDARLAAAAERDPTRERVGIAFDEARER